MEVSSTAGSCFFATAALAVIDHGGTLEVVFFGALVRDSVVTGLKGTASGSGSSPKQLGIPKLIVS